MNRHFKLRLGWSITHWICKCQDGDHGEKEDISVDHNSAGIALKDQV